MVIRKAGNTRENILQDLGMVDDKENGASLVWWSKIEAGTRQPTPEGWIGVICGLPCSGYCPWSAGYFYL